MTRSSISLASLLLFAACVPPGEELAESEDAVVEGDMEAEYLHPWIVHVSSSGLSCRGILIHRSWVLTAAHCIGSTPAEVTHIRTDPNTGAQTRVERLVAINAPSRGMFIHPDYDAGGGFASPENDIALLQLESPFPIGPSIQTVGLPKSAPLANQVGEIANYSHTDDLPPGYLAVFRAPIMPRADCPEASNVLCVRATDASLCNGDSGSGFVAVVDGRATVLGIASFAQSSSCDTIALRAGLTNVYSHRSWILDTINRTFDEVAGPTRLRWSGRATSGLMRLRCLGFGGSFQTITGPMNVPGAEININCSSGYVAAECTLGETPLVRFSGFTLRTTSNGAVTTTALPYEPDQAQALLGSSASSVREVTCSVSRIVEPLPPIGTNN